MKFFAVVIAFFIAIAAVESLPATGGSLFSPAVTGKPSSVTTDFDFEDVSEDSPGRFHVLDPNY